MSLPLAGQTPAAPGFDAAEIARLHEHGAVAGSPAGADDTFMSG